MTTAALYDHVEGLLRPRRLVDKSPLHVSTDGCLARLSRLSTGARYLRIARHPYSNGRSVIATGWYMAGLRAWGSSAWDRRTDPPTLDPQFHWLDIHDRIDRFFASLPAESCRTIRGEDLLSDPVPVLRDIARWLRIDDSDAAIEAMLHPERSPFAVPGPPNAELGNDPGFLKDPALRPYAPPRVPLSARLPWRGDGAGFAPEVIARARRFGYEDAPLGLPPLPEGFDGSWGPLQAIEPDGDGFPMAHGTLMDDSCVALPPLETVRGNQQMPVPAYGGGNFGAFTAPDYAVAVFDSPREPALACIDPGTGATLWQSELGLLPELPDGLTGRFIGGLLLARLRFAGGRVRRCIFVGNRAEIACLRLDGTVIWRRDTRNIVAAAGPGAREHGTPRCLRFTRDNALFYGTRNGYVGKLDPLTGRTIDFADLRVTVAQGGVRVRGFLAVRQSIMLHGDHAYLQGRFTPDGGGGTAGAPDDASMPTVLFRLQVSGRADGGVERLPDDLSGRLPPGCTVIGAVGDRRVGGSPSARLREDGRVVVFTNEYPEVGRPTGAEGSVFQLCGVRDDGDRLVRQWRCRVVHPEDAKITAAPAMDRVSDTLVATHRHAMLLFARASWREGDIRPDRVLAPLDCLSAEIRSVATAAEFSSPITIARHDGAAAFFAYVGLAVWAPWTSRSFAFLTALHIRPGPTPSVTAVWSRSDRKSVV